MSEINVDVEESLEVEEKKVADSECAEDPEIEVKSTSECENVDSESNEPPNSNDNEDEIGPPTVPDDAADDDKWCDNYQFIEDEKVALKEYEGEDPQKVVLLAAQNNELEVLRKFLEVDPNLVNARDDDLYTPLHRASYNNNVEVIRILLSYDADVRAKTVDDWEPLHSACKWDSVEAVSLLIQNGADVNAQTKGHVTPLHLAASNVHGRRTLELLLWHPHIDPNIKNDGGDTAYEIAIRSGPLGGLFEILEESVNVY